MRRSISGRQTQKQSVQLSLSHVRLFVTPWTAAHEASLSITNSWSLLKLRSIALVMPQKHIIISPWGKNSTEDFRSSGGGTLNRVKDKGGGLGAIRRIFLEGVPPRLNLKTD